MNTDMQKRTVKYINRDFAENRLALINFLKTYFPNQFSDFNEASPQMGLIEAISYVGDVLSFHTDIQLQESLLNHAEERINLYNLAQSLGYKAKTVVPASVELDIYQLVPSIGSGNNTRPDFRYALFIEPNMQVSTTDGEAVFFRTVDSVDFRFSSSYDPTVITTYSVTNAGEIEYYLLRKKVKAVSGELRTAQYSFSDPKQYDKIVIPENSITEIVSVIDSDNNKWYQVDYLAQDMIQQSVRNLPYNDAYLSQYRSSVPYLLTYKQTERRFVTRLRKDDFFEIQFGGGMSAEADEEIVPNPMNVGIGLNYFERTADVSIDPMNFLYTKTYGSAPSNTILTIQYAVSNGLSDNVNANTLTKIVSSNIISPIDSTDSTVLQTILDSVSVNNPFSAFGGQNRKPLEVIREEAMANFAAQNRSVTKEDYILRCFAMPAKYGAVSKAYIEADTQLGSMYGDRTPNPYSLNLYVMSYDANKNFVQCNEAIKENLRQYMRGYRLMTDAINIKDPYIINIAIDVEIVVRPNENSNEVSLRVVNKLIELMDNDNRQINEPLIISNLTSIIDRIEGVQSVHNIEFSNLYDQNAGYSGNVYDIKTATRGGIIYPPIDPSIFEVKYPKVDIRCRATDV
jgi:hypothetical protein